MKMSKKIVLIALAAVLLVSVVSGAVFSINATNTTDYTVEATMSPEEEAELDKKIKLLKQKMKTTLRHSKY